MDGRDLPEEERPLEEDGFDLLPDDLETEDFLGADLFDGAALRWGAVFLDGAALRCGADGLTVRLGAFALEGALLPLDCRVGAVARDGRRSGACPVRSPVALRSRSPCRDTPRYRSRTRRPESPSALRYTGFSRWGRVAERRVAGVSRSTPNLPDLDAVCRSPVLARVGLGLTAVLASLPLRPLRR